MDNRIDLPNYKYYVDRKSGKRADVYVTFLNIRPCPDESVSGVLFKVDSQQLEKLDSRERNYNRIDITQSLSIKIAGRAWVYIGKREAESRYKSGLADGSAVISQSYYEVVYNAYLTRGEHVAADYLRTTDAPSVPLMDLQVIKTAEAQQ